VQQLFDALFEVTLVALVVAPVVCALLLVWPRGNTERRIARTGQMHARA
jgi:hypothetical protein